jgi:hypothetical protein
MNAIPLGDGVGPTPIEHEDLAPPDAAGEKPQEAG